MRREHETVTMTPYALTRFSILLAEGDPDESGHRLSLSLVGLRPFTQASCSCGWRGRLVRRDLVATRDWEIHLAQIEDEAERIRLRRTA